MNRTLANLAVVVAILLVGAGCSRGSGTSDTGNTAHDKALRFSQCMRTNGVGEFPDPSPSGNLTLAGVVNVNFLDPSAPAWRTAIRACRGLQPAGFTDGADSR